MYCTKCGKKIPDGKHFCVFCGAPTKQTAQDKENMVNAASGINHTADSLLGAPPPKPQKEQRKKKKGYILIGSVVVAFLLAVGVVFAINNIQDSTPESGDTEEEWTYSDNDPLLENSLSEEEAKNDGGIFVKSEDRFFPLQETNVVNQSWGSGWNDGVWNSLYYMNSSDVYVPLLTDSDQLVFFSSGDVPEYEALEVKKQGHTIDAVFWGNRVTQGINNATVYAFGELGESDLEVLEVNGEDYKSFLENHTVNAGDYCTNKPRASIGEEEPACSVIVADLEASERITLSYYEGTEKHETELVADQEYWITDGCERWGEEGLITTGEKIEVELGENAYGTIDVSDLDAGTYIIRASAASDGYVLMIE